MHLTKRLKDQLPEGWGYRGFEFGAGSYPDSLCCGGRLYDTDNRSNDGTLFDPMEDLPCPMCRRQDAVEYLAAPLEFSGASSSDATFNACSLVDEILRRSGQRHRNRDGDTAGMKQLLIS